MNNELANIPINTSSLNAEYKSHAVLKSDITGPIGIITALPTFYDQQGKIDYCATEKILQIQIEAQVPAVVIGGSTGELMLMSNEEYLDLIKYLYTKYSKKIQIIGCCSSASTDHSVYLASALVNIGIEKALCSVPFYVQPNQTGIYQHFSTLSNYIDTIIYSVPSRTVIDMSLETIVKLSHLKGVIGYKDASANISRISHIKNYITIHNLEMSLLSGDDATYLGFMAQGGDGIISVISNLIPEDMMQIYLAITLNDFNKARQHYQRLWQMIALLGEGNNPAMIKCLLSIQHPEFSPKCREPIATLTEEVVNKCKTIMQPYMRLQVER